MDNTETGEGGLIVLLWQICNLQTIEASKAVFGTKCLNIFATGCSKGGKVEEEEREGKYLLKAKNKNNECNFKRQLKRSIKTSKR